MEYSPALSRPPTGNQGDNGGCAQAHTLTGPTTRGPHGSVRGQSPTQHDDTSGARWRTRRIGRQEGLGVREGLWKEGPPELRSSPRKGPADKAWTSAAMGWRGRDPAWAEAAEGGCDWHGEQVTDRHWWEALPWGALYTEERKDLGKW